MDITYKIDVSSGSLPSGAWSSDSLPPLWNLDPENKLSIGERENLRWWRKDAVVVKRLGTVFPNGGTKEQLRARGECGVVPKR